MRVEGMCLPVHVCSCLSCVRIIVLCPLPGLPRGMLPDDGARHTAKTDALLQSVFGCMGQELVGSVFSPRCMLVSRVI